MVLWLDIIIAVIKGAGHRTKEMNIFTVIKPILYFEQLLWISMISINTFCILPYSCITMQSTVFCPIHVTIITVAF